MATTPGQITALLRRIEQGDAEAHNQLASLVRDQLKRIAANRLRRERPDHLYQTSDLVQEAYLRLFKMKDVRWEGHEHFFKMAAVQMRRILVEYARHAYRDNPINVPLAEVPGLTISAAPNLLAVDGVLTELARIDQRRAQIVELKYFGGFKLEEIAALTGQSLATVKRRWISAKAFIKHHFNVGRAVATTELVASSQAD
jgi:RNA polymerase sigma-70 factor, ECF subfamily